MAVLSGKPARGSMLGLRHMPGNEECYCVDQEGLCARGACRGHGSQCVVKWETSGPSLEGRSCTTLAAELEPEQGQLQHCCLTMKAVCMPAFACATDAGDTAWALAVTESAMRLPSPDREWEHRTELRCPDACI